MRNFNFILFTLFAAVFLAMLPMPEWAGWGRPAWVLLMIIFWTMKQPSQANVGMAFTAGLLMDVLTGTMLGEHALAMTIVAYFVFQQRMRINMYPLLQQGMSILAFVVLYQAIIYCIQGFVGAAPRTYLYWLSSITSAILWPWLCVFMRDYCRWARMPLTE